MQTKVYKKMAKGAKRFRGKTKEYEKGSIPKKAGKLKIDYDKINLKDAAVKRFNEVTARKKSPAGKKRKSANPFGNISGFGGFGRIPQLGYKPAYKKK